MDKIPRGFPYCLGTEELGLIDKSMTKKHQKALENVSILPKKLRIDCIDCNEMAVKNVSVNKHIHNIQHLISEHKLDIVEYMDLPEESRKFVLKESR